MSQAGYTPIQLYFSTTAAAVPVNTNLANGELAINIQDEKLYFKNAAGTVKLLASNATSAPVLSFSAGTTGFTPSTATSGAITLAGTLATTNGGTGLTSFTANQVFYASSTSAFAQSANMTFNGTTLTVNDLTDSSLTATRVTYAGTAGNLVDSANLTFDGTNLTVGGSATATRFIPSGSTVATNGMYLPAANSLGLSTNSTEAMRIDSAGRIGIGGTASAGYNVQIKKTITGAVGSAGVEQQGVVQSDVTTLVQGFSNITQTAASAFTLSSYRHYDTYQVTLGAGSAITSQFGFYAHSSLTGATNNYGFYGNIASGTNRYNLYMAGTADNFLAGSTGVGFTVAAGTKFGVGGNITGATTANQVFSTGIYQSDVTSIGRGFCSVGNTQATAFTLANVQHFGAFQGTIGAGSAITNQFGFFASSSMIGATSNFGFYGDIASGTGRWNFYAAGTAQNYFSGVTGFGITPPASPGVSQIFSNLDISMAGSSRGILGNLYYQAAWKFVADGYGWAIADSSGALTFSLAGLNASGAGAAATPVERLRILANGAIGLSGANYGTSGQVLTSGGSGAAPTWTTVSGGGTPGGSTTQIQYNNAGSFAGSSALTFDGTSLTSTTTNSTGIKVNTTTAGKAYINIQSAGTQVGIFGLSGAVLGNNTTDVAILADSSGGAVKIYANAVSTNPATFNQYGLGIGAAIPSSGIGIAFPASQSASSDANTLDDYEEGTWTPTLTTQSGSLTTVSVGTGYYTKVGRMVTITCSPTIVTNGTGATAVYVGGLPFSTAANGFAGASRNDGNGTVFGINANTTSQLYIQKYDGTYPGGNGYGFSISLSYFV